MQNQFLLNALHITIDGLFDSVPILLSFMILSFGAQEKDAGVIIALINMVNTLAGLFTIIFSRHFGLFRTLSLLTFLGGLGFFANTFSHDIYLVGFFFIIGNAGFGLFHNVAFSYLSASCEKGSVGKAIGDFSAIGDIGRIPLASLTGFIAAFTILGFPGWRVVCFTYGLGALLFAGYILLFSSYRKEKPDREHLSMEQKKHLPSFSMLHNRQYALPISASVLDAFGSNQVFAFLPFLLFAKGIDPKILGAFAFAFTFGCLLGKIALGRAVDLFGTRKIFVVSELLMAILLVALLLGQQLFIVVGAAFLLGIVTKGTVPVVQTIITEPIREKHKYQDIIAINSFSRGISNIISPLLFGFIASAFDINWSFAIMAIAAVCAVIPILIMDTKHTQPMHSM